MSNEQQWSSSTELMRIYLEDVAAGGRLELLEAMTGPQVDGP